VRVIWATVLTGLIGEGAKKLLEKTLLHGAPKAEIEQLFSHLELIAPALAAVGILILIAGLFEHRKQSARLEADASRRAVWSNLTMRQAGWMGIVQGLALPFRGFSRSGSTISVGMLIGTEKQAAERFSFALAVVLTPAVVGMEALRLWKAAHLPSNTAAHINLHASLFSSMLGMVFSFLAGLLALKWLSRWLETGRWYLFGIYCVVASAGVYALHAYGF
jgi:undecaprenyl-diphosphatase